MNDNTFYEAIITVIPNAKFKFRFVFARTGKFASMKRVIKITYATVDNYSKFQDEPREIWMHFQLIRAAFATWVIPQRQWSMFRTHTMYKISYIVCKVHKYMLNCLEFICFWKWVKYYDEFFLLKTKYTFQFIILFWKLISKIEHNGYAFKCY